MVQSGFSKQININKCILGIVIMILSGCQSTPKTASDHARLAVVHVKQKNRNAALEHYTQAIALEPDIEKRCGYIINRAVLRHNEYQHSIDRNEEQDISGAEKDFNEAVRLCPDHMEARWHRGHFFVNTGHPEKGLEDYIFLVAREPANAFFWSMRATSYALLGECERAEADATEATNLAKGKLIEALYYQRRAWVRNKCGNFNGSIQDLDKSASLKKGIDKCPSLLMKGAILEEQGQMTAALATYEQCIDVCGGIHIDKIAGKVSEGLPNQAVGVIVSNLGKHALTTPAGILGAALGLAIDAAISEAKLAKIFRDDAERQIQRIKANEPPSQ